jgi:hypothetical protein
VVDNLLFYGFEFYQFVDDPFNDLFDFDVYVLLHDNFLNPVLEDGDLHDPFYFLDPFLNNNFGDDSLNNLGHFNDLLDYSGHDHYLLYDLLDFHDFGHFHHLLNDLFDWHFDLFDPVHVSEYFHDLLLDVFDGFGHFDVVIDYLLYFDRLGFSHDDGFSDVDHHRDLSFDCLDDGFFDVLCDFD